MKKMKTTLGMMLVLFSLTFGLNAMPQTSSSNENTSLNAGNNSAAWGVRCMLPGGIGWVTSTSTWTGAQYMAWRCRRQGGTATITPG